MENNKVGPTREEMLNTIYTTMVGCSLEAYRYGHSGPCLIGDVLAWIDTNCNRVQGEEGHLSRDIESHKKLIVQVYYEFVRGIKYPIEKQDDNCVRFVYDLVNPPLDSH